MCNNAATIEVLSGSNFKRWKQDLEFAMGCINQDMGLTADKPRVPTAESSTQEKENYEKWAQANKMCMLAMKRSIPEHLLSGLPNTDSAKVLLTAIGERYQVSDNAEITHLLEMMNALHYKDFANVREYIMKWVHVQSKLSAHKIDLPENYIVPRILSSLPTEFGMIKTAFNTQGESWTVNELITRCVAEEEKIKKDKGQSAFVVTGSSKGKGFQKGFKPHNTQRPHTFKKFGATQSHSKSDQKSTPKSNVKCFYCEKMGHMKKDCYRYKNWLEKKKKKNVGGNHLALVCFESNLADVSSNTWWIDSGASVHIAMTLQGFQKQRMPSKFEGKLKVGTNVEAAVEFIGVVRLPLDSGFELVLENVFYVPTFRRNLISVPILDKCGYCCSFQNGLMQLSLNSKVVGNAILSDGLYKLNLVSSYGIESLCAESSAPKRVLSNEKSSMLWHNILGTCSIPHSPTFSVTVSSCNRSKTSAFLFRLNSLLVNLFYN